MTAEFEITRDVITKSLRQGWSLPWREATAQLLPELQQAEEDRDEARRIAEVWRRKRDYTLQTKLEAEARLAKVPALIEAARRHRCQLLVQHAGDIGTCPHCEAIADYERETT